MKVCFYACTVFAWIDYREVMHGAVLSTTGLITSNVVPRPPQWRTRPTCHVSFFFSCSDQLSAHGGVGGETCMDVLVTSADKPRP